jgi:cytochrome c553
MALAAAALAAAAFLCAGSPGAARAAGDSATARGAALAAERGCGGCHGERGRSATENVPSLAGQPTEAVALTMILFRERLRDGPPMPDLAQDLTDRQIEDLAAFYASLPPGPPEDRALPDPARLREGARLSARLNCGACHLPGYVGQNQVPRLAGQREDYLLLSLKGYRDGTRRGTDTSMNAVVYGLSDTQLAALAHYLAQQGR